MPDDHDVDLTRAAPSMNVTSFRRPGGMAWMGELTRGEKGAHATVSNAVLVMGCDADLAGLVAYDEFANRIVITRAPPVGFIGARPLPGPYPRGLTDNDVTLIQGYIQRTFDMRISQPVAQQAVIAASEACRIHPVREWLDTLVWDKVPRVHDWLHFAFGCKKDAYHKAVGTKLLCAAIRRVRQPGCKFDHVLVLEGDQGKGKSSACEALFGGDWFSDNLPQDLSNKDAQQAMAGKWCLELGELSALIRSTNETAKAFFSRHVDHFRPSYGKNFVERPRQCVFIGTTNASDYLTDATGNRRYWPIFCEIARVAWVAEFRDQLWAEAAVLEAAGETLWLDVEGIQKKAVRHQINRTAEDVWRPKVMNWIRDNRKTVAQVSDILHLALALPIAQQNRYAEMRVAAVLKADGWMRHKHRDDDGKLVVSWFAPGQEIRGRPGCFVPTFETVDT